MSAMCFPRRQDFAIIDGRAVTQPNDDTKPASPRDVLAWCLANSSVPEALEIFIALHDDLRNPELASDVVTTADALVQALLAQEAPRPAAHAHMTILLSVLVDIPGYPEIIDRIFRSWLLHPASFGASRATPAEFQREQFVQRVADLVGWGSIDVMRDADALTRFFAWVNTWTPKNKSAVRRTIWSLRRNFPNPAVWNTVRV